MKTARKGRRDNYISIRSKLMAAVAMLLVASFMVVSSSYAWFTLSTAPEVKGIQTSVGSNGNLEIALYTGQTTITSGVGDGAENKTDKYETWGNLINLSDAQYGLSDIKLNPARLNVNETGTTILESPLMTPVYAADGRVTELLDNTIQGSYHSKKAGFYEYDEDDAKDGETVVQKPFGVRGIGNASKLNSMMKDYRNAKNAMEEALDSANSYVGTSLDNAGSDLASFAINRKLNNANSFNLTNLNDMLNGLETARQKLDTAILAYIKADFASDNNGADEDTYNDAKENYYNFDVKNMTEVGATVEGKTNEQLLAEWVAAVDGDSTTEHILEKAWTHRNYINTAVTNSRAEYNALKTAGKIETATWDELKAVLNGLIDLEEIVVNGKTPAEISADQGGFVQDYIDTRKLVVTISEPENNMTLVKGETTLDFGKGTYIEFAILTGDVTANITLNGLEYKGTPFNNIPATMNTNVPDAPTVDIEATATFPEEPQGEAAGAATIDDLYGYIVDLAFRTNAKDSQLCLQTKPVDRIYGSGSTNTETLGYGSKMFFSYTDTFDADDVTDLMKHIRIVFAETDGGAILGVAGLDTTEAVTLEGNMVSAPVKLYDAATYTLVRGFQVKTDNGNTAIKFADPDNEGKTTLTPLTQNLVKNISVYVYLDGDSVENKDVAATALASTSGTLNLQFSSTASLKPMEYSPLKGELPSGGSDDGE